MGYYYSKDHNDKDSDDAPMHQEESEWSHCIGGTRLAAGNSAAGLLHSPHDEKMVMSKVTKKMTMMMSKVILCKRGRCAQFLVSPNGILFTAVAASKAVADVGFSHILLLLSSFAAVLSPVADVSRQSLMSPPLSQIVPETQAAAGERGHLCCCHLLSPTCH